MPNSGSRQEREQILKELGRRITLHRNIKGFTLEELATRCAMEHKQLLEIESGKINILFKSLLRIAFHLEIEIKELLP